MTEVISQSEDNSEQTIKLERATSSLQQSWDAYYEQLNQLDAGYQVAGCLKLLNHADRLLNQGINLADAEASERNLIAGIKDQQVEKKLGLDHLLLGDMSGFASFKKVVKQDPEGFAKLMRVIPSNGPVDGWHFMQFIDTYRQWFEINGFKQCQLFPATRLLTMKRPDQFISLTEETLPLICQSMGIKPFKKSEFQRYWDDIIAKIHQCPWFKMHQPMDPAQVPFHRVRVALLERLLITPIDPSQIVEVSSRVTHNTPADQNEPTDNITKQNGSVTDDKQPSPQFIQEERVIKTQKVVKSPKKLTITQRQSAKVNQNAATKLMSQYYFANKKQFAHLNMAKHREEIVQRLIDGESVEEVFADYVKVVP